MAIDRRRISASLGSRSAKLQTVPNTCSTRQGHALRSPGGSPAEWREGPAARPRSPPRSGALLKDEPSTVDKQLVKHRAFGLLAALLFGVFVVTGVRIWVATHQEFTGSWSFFRYAIAAWILWTLGMFCLALAVAALPGQLPMQDHAVDSDFRIARRG